MRSSPVVPTFYVYDFEPRVAFAKSFFWAFLIKAPISHLLLDMMTDTKSRQTRAKMLHARFRNVLMSLVAMRLSLL